MQVLWDVGVESGHEDDHSFVGQLHVQNENLDPRRVCDLHSLQENILDIKQVKILTAKCSDLLFSKRLHWIVGNFARSTKS